MSKLILEYKHNKYHLDEFYKSLMFQRIMDSDLNRNERNTMLVILRKTLYFDKFTDRLAIHWLSKSVGIGEHTTRKTIKQLETKGLITVERSKGGQIDSSKRFNNFMFSNDLMMLVFRYWLDIKEEYDFR